MKLSKEVLSSCRGFVAFLLVLYSPKAGFQITALLGWVAVVIGLIGAALQYFQPSWPGFAFLALGLVGGAITITFAGPFKTVTEHLVEVKQVVRDEN